MSNQHNTLFLCLAGPMQSWGTSSRLQLRRTDAYPSKSGVLGLLLCAKGVRRVDSERELMELGPLQMGVRVDRRGMRDWDYHTAGAKTGMRKAEGRHQKHPWHEDARNPLFPGVSISTMLHFWWRSKATQRYS